MKEVYIYFFKMLTIWITVIMYFKYIYIILFKSYTAKIEKEKCNKIEW